jgi:MoxR-like ATPase
MKGPIFTNILLADEINRSPPKTQSALLEAMEERQATIEGETYRLSEPFLVMATQNPIEFEGTFPLPEAQVDRFLLKISTGYPKTVEEEELILRRRIDWRKDDPTRDIKPVVSQEEFLTLQKKVETSVYADGTILNYIAQIVRETRIHPKVEVGSSPRGGLALLKTARAIALINGRDYVIPDDVKTFSVEALAHRLILKPEHILERTDEKEVVKEVISKVPVPKEYRPR